MQIELSRYKEGLCYHRIHYQFPHFCSRRCPHLQPSLQFSSISLKASCPSKAYQLKNPAWTTTMTSLRVSSTAYAAHPRLRLKRTVWRWLTGWCSTTVCSPRALAGPQVRSPWPSYRARAASSDTWWSGFLHASTIQMGKANDQFWWL